MSLLDRARADVLKITTDLSGFGVAITITSPIGLSAVVIGTVKKHHLRIDEMGAPVSGKNASCSIAESLLVAANYPIRNINNEVNLKGHKVSWADSTGMVSTYSIDQWYPDETLGLIVCILGDFN